MRKGLGIACVLLGVLCLLASAGFVAYNRYESKRGEQFSQTLLQDVQEKLQEAEKSQDDHPEESLPNGISETTPQEMTAVSVGDYTSIGILSIPVLDLKLPVLTDWSYEKLKMAPCLYYGSCYTSDFVIAAHNYTSHFGRLSNLQPGDRVSFTDASGEIHEYEVVLLETLPPTATEEMITSGFDLSLYTCTPSGSNRVTVRCRRLHAASE